MAGRAFVASAFTPVHIKKPSKCILFSSLGAVAAAADAALEPRSTTTIHCVTVTVLQRARCPVSFTAHARSLVFAQLMLLRCLPEAWRVPDFMRISPQQRLTVSLCSGR